MAETATNKYPAKDEFKAFIIISFYAIPSPFPLPRGERNKVRGSISKKAKSPHPSLSHEGRGIR